MTAMPDNVVPFPSQPTTFRAFWDRGYHRLLPIIPPDAVLSEHSSIYKVLVKHPDKAGLGKIPGRLHPDGKWRSFPWACHETTEADLAAWSTSGAGVGIKCGGPGGLIGIDADTLDYGQAVIVRDLVEAKLGKLTVRVGQEPKALYVCRVDAPMRKATVTFGAARVEVLADGQQFVAAGVHPKTGRPYTWPRGIVRFDQLPVFPPAAILGLLEAIREALPDSGPVKVEGEKTDRDAVDQSKLKGDIETVRRAVAAIPNTEELFPLYTDMVLVGEAVHAACIDDPPAGFEIFDEWFSRYDGEGYDLETSQKVWASLRSPHSVGADFLFELADRHGGTSFAIDKHFENLGEPEPDWAELQAKAQRESAGAAKAAHPYFDMLTMRDLAERPDPKWLIDRHLPEEGLGFLYGDPGTGKSFLALDMALSIAYRLPDWHGDKIADADGAVIYIAGEGVHGFKARTKAWLTLHDGHGLAEGEEPRFRLVPTPVNLMSKDDVTKLIRSVHDVVRTRAIMIIVDTVSRSIPGAEENLQKDMSLFVEACGRLRAEFGCVVLGVHHAGKSGDMRGSTVLRGAGDFVLKLESKRESNGPTPGHRKGFLVCEKVKDGEDGWSDPYTFQVVRSDGLSSLVPVRVEKSKRDGNSTDDLPKSILTAMKAAWDAGRPWSRSARAGDRCAVRVLGLEFGLDRKTSEEILERWERAGIIKYRAERSGNGGKRQPGYEVVDVGGADLEAAENAELSAENGIFG